MSNTKTLLGFMAGAATGAIIGILVAPDKGSSTRKKIASKTGDLTDSVKESFGEFIDGLKDTYNGAKQEAEDLGDKLKTKLNMTKQEVKNSLS